MSWYKRKIIESQNLERYSKVWQEKAKSRSNLAHKQPSALIALDHRIYKIID